MNISNKRPSQTFEPDENLLADYEKRLRKAEDSLMEANVKAIEAINKLAEVAATNSFLAGRLQTADKNAEEAEFYKAKYHESLEKIKALEFEMESRNNNASHFSL